MIDEMLASQEVSAPRDEPRKHPAPCRVFGPWASARGPRLDLEAALRATSCLMHKQAHRSSVLRAPPTATRVLVHHRGGAVLRAGETQCKRVRQALASAPARARARHSLRAPDGAERAVCGAHRGSDTPEQRRGIAAHHGAPCADRSACEMRSGDIHRSSTCRGLLTPPLKPLSTEHAFVLVRVLVRSISGLALLPSPPPVLAPVLVNR
jgi:hypothetical protein